MGLRPGTHKLGPDNATLVVKTYHDRIAARAGHIYFRSNAVEASSGDRLSVSGALKMHGQTHPASFELSVGPEGELNGTARLEQSEWGIKPYRGPMGALRVRDSLEVVFEGRLPAA